MTRRLLWYVAYGSNTHLPRLRRYLERSEVPDDPVGDHPVTLHHRRFFAHESKVWTGGVAVLDPRVDRRRRTLARAWLLRAEQFRAVLAAENGAPDLELPEVAWDLEPGTSTVAGHGRYGRVLAVPSPDGRPALTFTSPTDPLPPPNPPVPAYRDTVCAGLAEAHGISPAAVAARL